MTSVDDIRRANLGQLAKNMGGVRALASKLGKSESQVSQWINGSADSKTGKPRGMRSSSCRAIERDLALPDGWLDSQHPSAGEIPPAYSLAHDLSHSTVDDAPLVTWGEKMLNGDSAIFWVALPDDSMAPRAPMGKLVCFDRNMQPMRGDGVLIQDAAGRLYFRQYRPAAGERFEAVALNSSYATLDSERDGLSVVAVLKAEEGRWA